MKTCLIIGNGPSLADVPNEFLAKYPTFGSNRVYLKFTPDYYSYLDKHFVGKNIEEIKKLDCKAKYIRREYASKVPGAIPMLQAGGLGFSFDPLDFVYGGYTITYTNLQLAYWHGFERVGLIGVDHEYKDAGDPLTWHTGKDKSHFSKDYYAEDETWLINDFSNTEPFYKLARKVYERDGREIINLTDGGALEIFEREDWRDW